MTGFPAIPGYRIERELGRGGMATVYLAHEEKLDRLVALKVLELLSAQGRDLAERFIREARTAARLQHSNIISIFDVGQAGNLNYIAMEYLPGGTLRDVVRVGAMGAAEALTIVQQLARVLGHAHSQGYIHRDIKPENIMFRRDGNPVLMDFGIARAVGKATRLTKTGMSVGTPYYMSPEQARGLELDGRADLYSLGVVLYEMLTGRVPYEAEDSVAVAIKHIQEPVPELPSYLSRYQPLLDRLLAKDREERVGSGEELVRLVGELGAGEAGVAGGGPRGTERVDLGSQRAGRTPPSGVRGVRISVGRTGRDTPESGLGGYGEEASRAQRSWVVPALMGMLVVAVGALLYFLSVGGVRRSETPLSAPSTQIEPARPGERPSGPSSSATGKVAVKTSWEELREKEFEDYLSQARASLAKGDLVGARRRVALAESIKKGTAEAESLKILIADAEGAWRAEEAKREQARRAEESARQAAEVERQRLASTEAERRGSVDEIKQEQTLKPETAISTTSKRSEGKRLALFKTSKGDITIEMYPDMAPVTVKNFLDYVEARFYDGLIFHRVIPGFMVQGGGMTAEMNQKPGNPPIKNEASNGLKNDRGTVAMARTNVVDSATSQFFINLVNNDSLNYRGNTPDKFGYCVFGKVVSGMDVVDAIAQVPTGSRRGHANVPLNPVTIIAAYCIDEEGRKIASTGSDLAKARDKDD